MSFTIYPAIDIRDGKCVRLLQGDYDKETVFSDSPQTVAQQFADQGAEWIHMVDLDGAKAGKPVNETLISSIAYNSGLKIQVGGGIRTEKDAEYYFNRGVTRVILGSSVLSRPDFVKGMLAEHHGRIAIGLDARDGYVATEGWTQTSKVKAEDLGRELAAAGAETFIFTDIATDGTLSGPNIEASIRLAEATGKEVIASGGVSSLADLRNLAEKRGQGVAGAIVGKALYTDRFTLAEALREVDSL